MASKSTNTNDHEGNALHHTAKIKGMLQEVINHVREDGKKVSDPKAQALFETTAEVLQGLVTAYDHFERRAEEPAQRNSSDESSATVTSTMKRSQAQGTATASKASSNRSRQTAGLTNAPHISREELKQKLESGHPVVLLDVRSAEDWQNSDVKLPGAIRVAAETGDMADEMSDRLNEVPDGAMTVVYCACPNSEESARIASALLEDNRHDVFVLQGGFDEWQMADYPLENKTAQEKSLEV